MRFSNECVFVQRQDVPGHLDLAGAPHADQSALHSLPDQHSPLRQRQICPAHGIR